MKKKLIKSSILFLSILSINISTVAVITYSFFHIQLEKVWVGEEKQNVDWTSWQKHVSTLHVNIEKVAFVTHKTSTVKISYILRVNGLQKNQVVQFLQQTELDLSQLSKPRWKSNFLGNKRFVPKLDILVQLPEKTSIELHKKIAPIFIKGVFATINIDIENQDIKVENSKIDKLILHCTGGRIEVEQSTGNELTIISRQSSLSLHNSNFTLNKVFNENGSVHSKGLAGQIEIENNSGSMHLEDPRFAANSTIYLCRGKGNILFMGNIPKIDIDEIDSKVQNNIFSQNTNEHILKLKIENAHLLLERKHK